MYSLAHIVNPVKVDRSSDLYVAQPVTFKSMCNAQAFMQQNRFVRLLSQQYGEDRDLVPKDLELQENLCESVLDKWNFIHSKKLPFIRDLLSIKDVADYYIYTNVDIALMPHFYITLQHLLKQGYDAIAINRRTISPNYQSPSELPLMYAEVGEYHRGIDCFVFSREALKNYKLHNAFIGSGPVGLCFVANMIAFSSKFVWLEKSNLTFHIGDDRAWANKKYNDYREKNFGELYKICCSLLLKDKIRESTLKSTIIEEIRDFAADYILYLKGEKKQRNKYNHRLFLRYYSNQEYDKIQRIKDQDSKANKRGVKSVLNFLKLKP